MGVTPNGIWYPDPATIPKRADLQQLAESVEDAVAARGEAHTYTPSWTAVGSGAANPALGDTQISGDYVLIGAYCFYRIQVIVGSTSFSPGVGSYRWSLPVPMRPFLTTFAPMGQILWFDVSTGVRHVYSAGYGGGLSVLGFRGSSADSLTASSPDAPAAGDTYIATGSYQRA